MANQRDNLRRKSREAGGSIEDLFSEEDAVDEFFSPEPVRRPGRPRTENARKPTHYKVVSISLYTEDIDRLNALVAELKARGHSRANKSMLIREALRQLDLDAVPPQR